MKRVLLYIGIALATIGCAKDEPISTPLASGEINFTAGVTTRVASEDDCAWASTDTVGIFADQSGEKNLLFTISDTESGALKNDSGVDIFPLITGERTFCAYHPYSEAQTTYTMDVDCTSDQSNPLLWATATSNAESVTLQFAHMYAKVQFALKPGGVDATSLEGAKAWLAGANAKATFDIESGGFTFDDESITNIALTIDKSDYTITAYLPPMESVAGNVKLWINTQDNTFVKTITDEKWESGSSYAYDITVGEEPNITSDNN